MPKHIPKIYCFSSHPLGGEGPAYAMAEDGVTLAVHYCSDECFVRGDLGVVVGSRPDHHEIYAQHYPDGYEMEFVPARIINKHEAFQKAFQLNQDLAKEAARREQD